MSDYIEVLDETDPGSNLVGDTLIHTDNNCCVIKQVSCSVLEKISIF